jgi:predicted dehydrogenase
VGVVGLGSFGRHHARHYSLHPGARLAVVMDADVAVASAVADQYACHVCRNLDEIRGRVDAVSVAVPAVQHAAVAGPLLDAGIHALVEKPLAVTAADGRDLVRRAERAGVILQAGHIERFSPAVEQLLARVTGPRRITCVRRSIWNGRATDVDVVLDLMIHDLDLVLALAGAPVASVSASGQAVRSPHADEVEAWITFANGAIATLSASRVADKGERRIVVTEPGAAYAADLSGPSLTVTDRAHWGSAPQAIDLEPRDNLAAEIDDFVGSVARGASPRVDGHAGVAALELAERVREALADGVVPTQRSFA